LLCALRDTKCFENNALKFRMWKPMLIFYVVGSKTATTMAHLKEVGQKERARDVQKELHDKLDVIAEHHQEQVDLRITQVRQLQSLVAEFQASSHDAKRIRQLKIRNDQLQDDGARIKDMDDFMTELKTLVSQHDARMNICAVMHRTLFNKEFELLQRLQAVCSEKNSKMKEIDKTNNKLREELAECKSRLQSIRELALFTKRRQLDQYEELKNDGEFIAMYESLKEDTAAIADYTKKQEAATKCGNAEDVGKIDGLNRTKSSNIPGKMLFY